MEERLEDRDESGYHGYKILVKCEDRERLERARVRIKTVFKINNVLITK
jgi:hypothetical protein